TMDEGATLDNATSERGAPSTVAAPALDRPYDPREIEARWYARWMAEGRFTPRGDSGKAPFTVILPPPNVTGSLTLGHVLNHTLQDVVVRWKRMEGVETLWLPGMDHAGIATQNVVEALLKKEGQTPHDRGREAAG